MPNRPRRGARELPDVCFVSLSHTMPVCVVVQNVKGHIKNARNIDAQLELRVTSSCLEELTQFPERYVTQKSVKIHNEPLLS